MSARRAFWSGVAACTAGRVGVEVLRVRETHPLAAVPVGVALLVFAFVLAAAVTAFGRRT